MHPNICHVCKIIIRNSYSLCHWETSSNSKRSLEHCKIDVTPNPKPISVLAAAWLFDCHIPQGHSMTPLHVTWNKHIYTALVTFKLRWTALLAWDAAKDQSSQCAGQHILDIGTGTGLLALLAAHALEGHSRANATGSTQLFSMMPSKSFSCNPSKFWYWAWEKSALELQASELQTTINSMSDICTSTGFSTPVNALVECR